MRMWHRAYRRFDIVQYKPSWNLITMKGKAMNINKLNHKPIGVILISGFYTFGAMILFYFFATNPLYASSLIAVRHGLLPSTGPWILLLVGAIALLIAWGLFSLSRWGYIFTLTYLAYFGVVNIFLSRGYFATIEFGNFIWSLLVISYLFLIRKQFFVNSPSGNVIE